MLFVNKSVSSRKNHLMNKNKIKEISSAVSSAISFLYQDSEAICDEDYYEEVMQIIRELEDAETALNEEIDNLS